MQIRRLLSCCVSAVLFALALAPSAVGASNDPDFPKQWGLTKLQAEQAWATSSGAGATIAIVDTGVDLGHPDLATKVLSFPDADMVEPNGTCKGSAKKGTRTCTQDGAQDKNGHGTHVAGIAGAATGNGIGVAGTAPDASLLPVRVLDAEGSGTTDQVAAGIRYAADKGANVINLSLGFLSGLDQVIKVTGGLGPVYDAIDYAYAKGAVVVIAAGNDSFSLCAEPSAHPKALCVGATDRNDVRTFYSNSDATLSSKFLVAPGGEAITCAGDIYSTYLRGLKTYCGPDGYEALAGTSMATPFVSGVAALLSAEGLGNDAIVDCIIKTTDDLGLPGRDSVYGYGRVNAAGAVSEC